jgi:type VI secretion system protein ImpL
VAADPSRLEHIVDDRFDRLRRFARSPAPGQPAPIDATVALIRDLHQALRVQQAAQANHTTPPPSDVPTKVNAESERLPEPLRSMLLALSQLGTTQVIAQTLDNISGAIPAAFGNFCADAVTGRYPFARTSNRDVTQDDFTRLFKPGGLIDDFFQRNLVSYIDTTTRPWKFHDSTIVASSSALLQFQRAQTIRDVFFRGPTPGFRLDFKPLEMDPTITQIILDLDGQLVNYRHGPQVRTAVQWPAPQGSMQARIQLAPPSPSGTSAQIFEGPWAMFRMFDRATIEATPQAERFVVTFNVDERKARFEVTTNSVQNPFRLVELEQFVCPIRL